MYAIPDRLVLTMVLMLIRFSAMLHWELKILFSILSCSATEQWGSATISNNQTTVYLPLAYTQKHFASIAIESHVSWDSTKFNVFGISNETLSALDVHGRWCDSGTVNDNGGSAYIISIGK